MNPLNLIIIKIIQILNVVNYMEKHLIKKDIFVVKCNHQWTYRILPDMCTTTLFTNIN